MDKDHHEYSFRVDGAGCTRAIRRAGPTGAALVDGASTDSGAYTAICSKFVLGHGHPAFRGAHVHVRGAVRRQAPRENPEDDVEVAAHERGRRTRELFFSHGASANPHVQ